MQSLTEPLIRAAFINASRKEVKEMTLPETFEGLTEADWQDLNFFGWRDRKFAKRGYVVIPRLSGGVDAVALTQAEAAPRSRAMCNWCRDVRLPNEVVLWSAKRVGDAGRRGATVGTLICREFQCSRNVRNDPPPAYDGYDVAAARVRRIEDLELRVASFSEMLTTGR